MSDPSPDSAWPLVRAAVLAVVIAVHGLAAAPLPHIVTEADLKNPVSAEEVDRWAERLTALGYTITAEELGQKVIRITRRIGGAHQGLLKPFRPVLRVTGTGQGWALFANPDSHPGRLVIRIHEPQGWRILHRRLDPEHDWAEDLLSYRRIRAMYDAGGYRSRPSGPYVRFAHWIGDRILSTDPDVDLVEVSTVRTHTTLPGQPPNPRTETRHVVTTRRRR
jgi:hypothetical protein